MDRSYSYENGQQASYDYGNRNYSPYRDNRSPPHNNDGFQSSPPPGYTYDTGDDHQMSRQNPFHDAHATDRGQYQHQQQQQQHNYYQEDGQQQQNRAQELGYTNSMRTQSTTTPGMDNLGPAAAGGGISGIAYGVANQNERESGVQAMRAIEEHQHHQQHHQQQHHQQQQYQQEQYQHDQYQHHEQHHEQHQGRDRYAGGYTDSPYVPEPPRSRGQQGHDNANMAYPAAAAIGGGAAAGGAAAAWAGSRAASQQGSHLDPYPAQPVDPANPFKRYSSPWDSRVDQNDFNPDDIEDDGDDEMMRDHTRRSMLSLGRHSDSNLARPGAGGVAYGPVAGGAHRGNGFEKSSLLAEEAAKRKRKRIIFIILGVLAFLAIAAGAVVGGILGSKKASENSSTGSSKLNKGSSQVKDLLNNPDLHRVFPGVDYTPFNAQYPDCLSNPPSQDNVTMDVAVLSQLTNTIRTYGTDCNQTDMILTAIDKLELTDMKLWLGIWLDNNKTTNARGMNALWDILDKHKPDPFAGVIIGNEVLFREDMTPTELANVVAGVRSKFTSKKIDLPIAVADLGDNWAKDGADFIQNVDVVMSNIHPFFGGVPATKAASWTWSFWKNNDIALTEGTKKKNVISEVGWPSEGGNDCGTASGKCASKTEGAVAGIDEMNQFMDDFVCPSLANGTTYFWFEAFDEPWKKQYNKGDQNWEDRWGLMTPDRKLKPGVKIPDCGGKTV